jgi:proteasome lid subunit RPN8/RPN11
MIRISEEILKQICANAEQNYPNECCGFLIGMPGSIREISPAENTATEHRQRRYLISPLDFLKAHNCACGSGMEVIGTYHSHPDHPPSPSELDRKQAFPNYLYLIVNVTAGGAGMAACWMLSGPDSEFAAEELAVEKLKSD